jgi:hypothetical protein
MVMEEEDLIKFLRWYWREIQGKPYHTTAEEIVKFFMDDLKDDLKNEKR